MNQEFETIRATVSGDKDMAADVFGQGSDMLLIHGIPGGPGAWYQVATSLAGSFRLIVPHLLGFQDSARPLEPAELWVDAQAEGVLAICDQLGVQTAVLVGHDFGGPVAAKLVELRPSGWTHLALFSTNVFADTPIPPPLSFAVLPLVGGLFRKLLFSRPSLAMMLRQGVGRPGVSLASVTYLGDKQQVNAIGTIFSHALTNLDSLYPPVEQALAGFGDPALVGWGDKDPFFSVEQGRRTAGLVNGAFSLYEGAGHFTPEECVAEIVADLHRLVQGAGSESKA
jgi:pimeloyl-ACP methyl ester carboxylesterase